MLWGYTANAQTITHPLQQNTPDGECLDSLVTVVDDGYFRINTDKFIKTSEPGDIVSGVNFERDSIIRVDITGRASVDGPEKFNNSLASERANRIAGILTKEYHVPEDRIFTMAIGEDWGFLSQLVTKDSDVPYKAQLLDIINNPVLKSSTKEARMRRLGGGVSWRYLLRNILPKMRSAEIVWQLAIPVAPRVNVPSCPPVYVGPDTLPADSPVRFNEIQADTVEIIIADEAAREWQRKLYLKTNAPAWAMLWQNFAIEVDLAPHWSFALPLYWSPYNYGKETRKFRTLSFIPELRFWLQADNTGFFVNAHFGLAYYNYANGGEYRYQDHDGRTPAVGGGVGLGYRFYFCRNHRWSMEVGAGAGIYRLDYDVFQNTPETKNGYLLERRKRTFFGIDQAFVTFSYSFGIGGKGGGKI